MMELLELVKLGTPVLVLGMLVFLERMNGKLNQVVDDVQDIKDGIVWKDNCEVKHESQERRLENLERVTGLNGRRHE